MKSRKFYQFSIRCTKEASFGQAVYLVGNISTLGSWDPNQAIKLEWTQVITSLFQKSLSLHTYYYHEQVLFHFQGDIWTCELNIPLRKKDFFFYKFFVSSYEYVTNVVWEKGPNRVFSYPNKQNLNKHEIIQNEWNLRTIKIVFFSSFYTSFSADLIQQRIYLQGSSYSLGQFSRMIEMERVTQFSNMVGITYVIDIKINVTDDLLFYYKFIYEQHQQQSTSSLYVVRLMDVEVAQYYKNFIFRSHGRIQKDQLQIFQMQQNIFYGTQIFLRSGTIPKNIKDISRIKRLNFDTIIKFIAQSTEINNLENSQYCNPDLEIIQYYVDIDEKHRLNILEDISKLLRDQILIKKVLNYKILKKLFLCSPSISYLRKYLNIILDSHLMELNVPALNKQPFTQ